MDGGRRTSTVRQIELLVKFAEANRDLALGRLRSKEARALSARLWRECSITLNSEGPARLPKEWAKVWNDMKSRVRSKLCSIAVSKRCTGGGPYSNSTLTALEERVADIIGRDIGPTADVAQDQLYSSNEPNEQLQLNLPGLSSGSRSQSLLLGPSSQPVPESLAQPRPSTPLSPRPSSAPSLHGSLPPSLPSTSRQLWQRTRQRRHRIAGRVQPQAQTSRYALEDSRAAMMRIEELRARTDHLLARSALRRAGAAKVQSEAALIAAEANRQMAQAMSTFCQSVANLVPAVQQYLQSLTDTERLSTTEEESN